MLKCFIKNKYNGIRLSHLCFIQGEKAQFSSLNEHFLTQK